MLSYCICGLFYFLMFIVLTLKGKLFSMEIAIFCARVGLTYHFWYIMFLMGKLFGRFHVTWWSLVRECCSMVFIYALAFDAMLWVPLRMRNINRTRSSFEHGFVPVVMVLLWSRIYIFKRTDTWWIHLLFLCASQLWLSEALVLQL